MVRNLLKDAADEVDRQPRTRVFLKSGKETVMSELKTLSKDPICGMEVDEATALKSLRDGKAFYFCSEQCQQKFETRIAGDTQTCCG